MILAIVRMMVPPETRGQISKTLKSMVRDIMFKPGCISSRLYHDENEEDIFVCEQAWKNQEYLNQYLRSEDYLRMLLVFEMASEPPEIEFQTIAKQAGIEVIEKARGCKKNEEV